VGWKRRGTFLGTPIGHRAGHVEREIMPKSLSKKLVLSFVKFFCCAHSLYLNSVKISFLNLFSFITEKQLILN